MFSWNCATQNTEDDVVNCKWPDIGTTLSITEYGREILKKSLRHDRPQEDFSMDEFITKSSKFPIQVITRKFEAVECDFSVAVGIY